ncbi:hypothetical protein [Clostridium kluyveri]|uniref:Uncharacterized protein n=2 Tax=Clostridium kluyveri TaxID=1534 RepID=A5N283_CLOK5|nr:hypothetical protein [Clostridium kluyveri]EDK35229.1 Hypothetical protein CKL_3226 [Clostridium kluyveri DSM 555]BAH07907.1 hypothetical protein CKR_2856 [Clostridium kluyveri NBRC 12016]
MDIEQNNLLDLIKCLNIKVIDSSVNFWMVRTKKGFFYDEFIREKFIALGWNAITKDKILNVVNEENKKELKQKKLEIKKYIERKYPITIKTKQAIKNFNKCVRFFYEMKDGDIVMIPSHGNNSICFARVGEYYEDINCTYEKELEIINRIDSKESYGIEEICPYKKRRKITILKTIDSERININLYKALASYHGLSDINDYSDFILSSIYNIYYRNNKINIVFNIEKEKEIGAIDFSKFMYNISQFFYSMDNSINVSTKMNLNSPGDVVFIVQQIQNNCNNVINVISSTKVLFGIICVWIAIGGGKIGPIQLPNAMDLFIKYKEHRIKMKNEYLNKELKEKQIEEEDLKLKQEKIKLLELCKEINIASSNLEVNKDDVNNVIDFNKYRHEKHDK